MLKALIDSANQFNWLPEVGYDDIRINWIVDIEEHGTPSLQGPYRKAELTKSAPVAGDRSGVVSEENSKPALLVDTADYALGVSSGQVATGDRFRWFRELADKAADQTHEPDAQATSAFLASLESAPEKGDGPMTALKRRIKTEVRPKDMVAFKSLPDRFAFEAPAVAEFWRHEQKARYATNAATCGLCGKHRPTMRILPWQVSLAGYSCPISASNRDAFNSFGKKQTENSPLCFECSSKASQVLQYLLGSERHHRTLARDDSKGQGKSPLRNQMAVFWLKEPPPTATQGEVRTIDLEAALAGPLLNDPNESPPPDPEQVKALYALPWSQHRSALTLDRNRFYAAVLSPNKSRLVLREWIDQSLDAACSRLQSFDAARSIIAPDGTSIHRATIPTMLQSLKPWRSTSTTLDANHVRGLVRTAYAGAPVPQGLLESAVRRFRIPDKPGNGSEREELEQRRAVLAATIKLALTYGTKEAHTLQTANVNHKTAPYLCGLLLAVLEEAQARASSRRIGATLVDRFYSSASTSPGGVLPILVKRATTDHLPKVRRNSLGHQKLSQALEATLSGVDDAGGFPATLNMREQGEFALGFYHQRALFRAERPQQPQQTPEKDKEENKSNEGAL